MFVGVRGPLVILKPACMVLPASAQPPFSRHERSCWIDVTAMRKTLNQLHLEPVSLPNLPCDEGGGPLLPSNHQR
ncbi:hypothetical protein BXZ70DRAFT_518211 [Cristinia sonorae]|uniref:Uncharacterized protein n=1 Tax=Cristinia sonorae TaxID=1940300 RepID=A0A8K0UUZ2_9AGAR|nr:hypothetical protein BXZ70DRAFT_518211 [Cristinia sonorae]